MSKHTCPKVNIEAVREAVFNVNIDYVAEQQNNGLNIKTNDYIVYADEIIALSIKLYGVHNAFYVQATEDKIMLNAGVYRLLPEFLVPGEEVEFELEDRK